MTQPGAAPPPPAGDAIPPAAERQAPSRRRRRAVLAVLGVAVAIVALAGEPMGLPPLVAVSALAVLAFVLLAFALRGVEVVLRRAVRWMWRPRGTQRRAPAGEDRSDAEPGLPRQTAGAWLRRHRSTLLVVAALLTIVLVGGHLAEQRQEDRDVEEARATAVMRRTGGGAGAVGLELAEALAEQDFPETAIVDTLAMLTAYTDGDLSLDDLEAAQWLAAWEEAGGQHLHQSASRSFSFAAYSMDIPREGLAEFIETITYRQEAAGLPIAPAAAGIGEHFGDYEYGCWALEGVTCPVKVVADLTFARQRADFERWGHVDCGAVVNEAHPACLPFPDCAPEYAVRVATRDAANDAYWTAQDLGHEPGTAGFETWTADADAAEAAAFETHEACIASRYGEEPFKALVAGRPAVGAP